MCLTVQADSAAGFGVSDVLHNFTRSLKEEFMGIIVDSFGKAKNLDWEATMQRAADLCAERCRQNLLRQINGSNLGTAFVEALEMPLRTEDNVKEPAKLNRSSCDFFDLTRDDNPDDAKILVGALLSGPGGDLSHDSIEFIYTQGFETTKLDQALFDLTKDDDPSDVAVLADNDLRSSIEFMFDQGLDTINSRRVPDEFIALWQDIRGLQDLRDFTAKDLHALFQDIRGLQKQLQDVKADLEKTQLQNDETNLQDEKGNSEKTNLQNADSDTKIRSLQQRVQDIIGNLPKTKGQDLEGDVKKMHEERPLATCTMRPDESDQGKNIEVSPQKFPERPCATVVANCPESFPSRRRILITRKPESKQWVAAKSPGVYGDIGDRIRDKLLNRQNQIKSMTVSQLRRHSIGS
eukprot:gnl/MRDRNA2_/MRDRNA2_73478_c0_seq1.p1 gnl/MRDRNA2_/MRDRNA2_73478_c0~~gnl/MRDRNA2_/MRDRNA2_73478_c0_seq1.p1  ORF type:complete len:407 (+),score=96.54 gnl/MRDRNA2_/MRDRNA2_73478_c0_seq1:86-1306(+)